MTKRQSVRAMQFSGEKIQLAELARWLEKWGLSWSVSDMRRPNAADERVHVKARDAEVLRDAILCAKADWTHVDRPECKHRAQYPNRWDVAFLRTTQGLMIEKRMPGKWVRDLWLGPNRTRGLVWRELSDD